jgi:hypothetical protein
MEGEEKPAQEVRGAEGVGTNIFLNNLCPNPATSATAHRRRGSQGGSL